MALMPRIPNTIRPEQNLGSVTTIAHDEHPDVGGISPKGIEDIWLAVRGLYRSGYMPGISVCLRRHGKIVMHRSIGHASGVLHDERPKRLLTPDTPVCLFSASKAVTALLVHKLAEQGEIGLHDPVAKYIPKFGVHGKGDITIHDVLSHRGEVPSPPPGTDPALLYDWDAALDLICSLPPKFGGKRSVAYHAITGGFLFGEIVKLVTGKTIREYHNEVLRGPLGFKWFDFGVAPSQVDEVAVNYSTGPKLGFPVSRFMEHAVGAPLEAVTEISNHDAFKTAIIPAANMYATADELSQFYQCLLNGGELNGKRIFNEETVAQAVRPVGGRSLDRTLMLPIRYSAGLMLGDKPVSFIGPDNPEVYGHLGFLNIIGWADPERDLSAAVMTTGKAVIGAHLGPWFKLLGAINKHCHRV